MGTSSKPRKQYRPKPVVVPLNMRDRWMTEGDCHAILLAMEGKTFCEQHLADLVAHADVVGKIARRRGDGIASRHALALMRVAIDIQARNQATGTLTATALDETAIRASFTITMPVIAGASNLEILTAAESTLKQLRGRRAGSLARPG